MENDKVTVNITGPEREVGLVLRLLNDALKRSEEVRNGALQELEVDLSISDQMLCDIWEILTGEKGRYQAGGPGNIIDRVKELKAKSERR